MTTAAELVHRVDARVDAYVACVLKHFADDLGEIRRADAYVPPKVCGDLSVYAAERAGEIMTARLPGFRVSVFTDGEAYAYREPTWRERFLP